MDMQLTEQQARVIGCLLEKEITTPDQYPLTLNALTTACNQKSSREPVMALEEATVLDTLEELKEKRMVSDVSSFGSRVSKFQHRFCNTEFGSLQFTKQELAAIIVLLLRGYRVRVKFVLELIVYVIFLIRKRLKRYLSN